MAVINPDWALDPPLIADGSVRDALALRLAQPDVGAGSPSRSPMRGSAGEAPTLPEALNVSRPEWVREVHEAFARAGARLHRTNTRAAHRPALEAAGLAERCEAVNVSGSALVRAAIGTAGVMMGCLGPIGAPGGAPLPLALREQAWGEQAVYLSDTGVDVFLLEHIERLEDALAILRVVKRTSDAPVLAQLRFDAGGRTAEGIAAGEAARRLAAAGADALGVGCGPGPAALPPLVEALLGPGLPVGVMVGVATPGTDGPGAAASGTGSPASGAPYPGAPALGPQAFAEALLALGRLGVTILGGCCGVGPRHIHALARARAKCRAGRNT